MKSKKILTILLSLAIMFTFMPAMAFAYTTSDSTNTYDWGDNFTSVEVKNAAGNVVKTYGDVRFTVYDSTGLIEATAYENGTATSVKAYYYDLKNSVLYSGTTEVKGEWNYTNYTGLYGASANLQLKLAKPDNITTAQWAAATGYALNGKIKTVGTYAASANKGDVETINTTVYTTTEAEGTSSAPYILGTSPSATVTINDGNTGLADGWYVDTVSSSTSTGTGVKYDGKEHKIVYNANVAVGAISYEKYDTTKGEWVAGGDIVVKDAGNYGTWRAVYTSNTGAKAYGPAELRYRSPPEAAGDVSSR